MSSTTMVAWCVWWRSDRASLSVCGEGGEEEEVVRLEVEGAAARAPWGGAKGCGTPPLDPPYIGGRGARPKPLLGPATGVSWPPSLPPRVRVSAGPLMGPFGPHGP